MKRILLAIACAGTLSACGPTDNRTMNGALLGGGAGALIGGVASNSVGGALVGGAVGAAGGAVIAHATRPHPHCYYSHSLQGRVCR
jgi:osmotically inducible lipoprotein OsmB